MARLSEMLALLCILGAAAAAQAQQPSFYDRLKADPQHKFIMRAVDGDPNGQLKALLQQTVPITAFVPTDQAFIRAAMRLRGASRGGMGAGELMKNHCLIAAILKQHMLPGVYETAQLEQMDRRGSMLVTKKTDPATGEQVSVSWPLKFSIGHGHDLTVTSAAFSTEGSRRVPATSGSLVAPMNVRAGSGILHNINGLLLPMTDLARLARVTGCA